MKQQREEAEEQKRKKRKQNKQNPDVYYPGMIAESISGIPGNLLTVSEITDFLMKKRKGRNKNITPTSQEEINVSTTVKKKKKQQIEESKSDGNITVEKLPEHTLGSKENSKIGKSGYDRDKCTVFVGNLPNTITKKRIFKYFKKFGSIVNTRLRCAAVSDPRIPKRLSVIKKDFHKDRSNIHAYICFSDENSANRALEANGKVFEGYHLRVDLAAHKEHENKKAVFIGNLAFSAEENALWELFEKCGPINSIRIVRDQRTGMGKGFGYVNFKSEDSVELALQLNGENVKERPIRVSRCGKLKGHKNSGTKIEPKLKQRIKLQKLSTAESAITLAGKKSIYENEKATKTDVRKSKDSKLSIENYQGQTALARKKKKKKIRKYVIKKKRITQQLNSTDSVK